jgi:small subunit ribosomal protein S20
VPNSPSARKRVRQSAKRHSLNQWRKRRIKDQVKSFLQAVQSQNVESAEAEFRKACGLLDKIACTSTMHRNTAARKKSRLSRRLADLKRKTAAA